MTNVWCVRANRGEFANQFVSGGYVAIGWVEIREDLSRDLTRNDLATFMRKAYPDVTSSIVQGNWVGQVARFMWDIKPNDFVITPSSDSERLHYGRVSVDPTYTYGEGNDGCPYIHRKRVEWAPTTLRRGDLSVPLQNTLRSLLTVFYVSQREEFLNVIGRSDLVGVVVPQLYDPYRVVLEQILELDDKEFEILVGHLLTALGFEGSEVVGKTGDGGVDATGELNVFNLARVKVFVQAKRYKLGTKISANTVKQLRQAIPFGGQGAFITTADFQSSAGDMALESGFPRIGLINGRQLVDLLIQHWADIPLDFQERLGLKPGLVRV
jgi:restriction system protein